MSITELDSRPLPSSFSLAMENFAVSIRNPFDHPIFFLDKHPINVFWCRVPNIPKTHTHTHKFGIYTYIPTYIHTYRMCIITMTSKILITTTLHRIIRRSEPFKLIFTPVHQRSSKRNTLECIPDHWNFNDCVIIDFFSIPLNQQAKVMGSLDSVLGF